MYCPQCGQQQIADDMRFCSRCGLPVSGLAEWIAGAGAVVGREEAQMLTPSPKRKGIRRGAKLMFLSGVLVPLFFGLSLLVENPAPLLLPFAIFLVGLSIMLYFRIFGEDIQIAKGQQVQPSRLGAMLGNGALPPASGMRMNGISSQRVKTAELAQPPSVTEHTTRLLDAE